MVLGAATPVSSMVIEDLKMNETINFVFWSSDLLTKRELQTALGGVDVIYCNLPAENIDQNILTLFEALHANRQVLKRFILLTDVGVNGELSDQTELTKAQQEIRWQQQYAIKIVDEEEIDYTIIRQSPLAKTAGEELVIYQEGQSMPKGTVGVSNVVKISLDAIFTDQFVNQSIGLIDHLTTEESK